MKQVKKVAIWTVLAFVVYAVVTSPSQAADIARTVWDIIAQGFDRIGSFFQALLNQK